MWNHVNQNQTRIHYVLTSSTKDAFTCPVSWSDFAARCILVKTDPAQIHESFYLTISILKRLSDVKSRYWKSDANSLSFDKFNQRWIYTSNFMVQFCSPMCFGQEWPCSNCSLVQFKNTVLMYRPPVLFMSTYDCHQKYSYSLSFDKFNPRCIYMSNFMVRFCSLMHFGQDWPCSNCSLVLFPNLSILTISIFNRPRDLKSRCWKSDV